jgi:hypothetical protein
MALMLQLLLKNPFKKSDGEDGEDAQSEAAAFRRIWAAFLSGKRRLKGLSMGSFDAYPWSVKGRLASWLYVQWPGLSSKQISNMATAVRLSTVRAPWVCDTEFG